MNTIDEDIKSGQFKKIYLLYGDEAYLKKQYKDKLKKAMVQPDDTMNFTAYEGKDTNPKEVIDRIRHCFFLWRRKWTSARSSIRQ